MDWILFGLIRWLRCGGFSERSNNKSQAIQVIGVKTASSWEPRARSIVGSGR